MFNNISNSSIHKCEIIQNLAISQEFAECYIYFFKKNPTLALFEIFLASATVVCNLLVIILLWFIDRSSSKMNIFDQILIGHAFVDGLTGLIDMPLFHIASLFGYWPLPSIIAQLWAAYDNNINTTTSMHMLYMSYVRLRSIQSPRNYLSEKLIKRPVLMMASFWAISLTIWFIIVFTIGLTDFTLSVAFDDKTQYIGLVLNFIGWFVPLMLILAFSLETLLFLGRRSKKIVQMRRAANIENTTTNLSKNIVTISTKVTARQEETARNTIKDKKRLFYFKPQTVFLIIISTYWLQWTPPCILSLTQTLCNNCIDSTIYNAIYWLTYTVCLVDAIVVLLFNPNVSFFKK